MVGPDGPLYGLPVGAGSRFRERTQEADGRTAIDRVLKKLCEGLKVLTYPVFVDSTNDRRHLPGITLATRGPTSWLPIVGSRRMRAVRITVRIRRGGRPPRLRSGRAQLARRCLHPEVRPGPDQAGWGLERKRFSPNAM